MFTVKHLQYQEILKQTVSTAEPQKPNIRVKTTLMWTNNAVITGNTQMQKKKHVIHTEKFMQQFRLLTNQAVNEVLIHY